MSESSIQNRRLFMGALTTTLLAGTEAVTAAEPPGVSSAPPAGARVPRLEFVYESKVTIAPALDVGVTSEGHRRIIPITGGTFEGPQLRGEVVANGADWNLQRPDRTSSVEAAYYLKTQDGVLIRITNKGASGPPNPADPHDAEQFLMFTSPRFEAPSGRYDWMNYSTFIGTLSVRRDTQGAVFIRVFKVV